MYGRRDGRGDGSWNLGQRAENDAGAPRQGWQPARQDRVGDRWRQHHDRVRAAATEGPARRGGHAAGQPWRTGADEATVLVTDKALKFGSYSLPAGTYTINTEPGDKGWQLIFGKLSKPGQWGVPYQKDLEIGRAPMSVGKDESAGRAAHDLDRRHADGRNAAHRVGRHECDRAVHGGIGQSTVVGRQSPISVVSLSRQSESQSESFSLNRQFKSSVGSLAAAYRRLPCLARASLDEI